MQNTCNGIHVFFSGEVSGYVKVTLCDPDVIEVCSLRIKLSIILLRTLAVKVGGRLQIREGDGRNEL